MSKTLEEMAEQLKTFTIADIRDWQPCYDPSHYLSEDWSGTVIDILKHTAIPPEDRLWVVCRDTLIDSKTLRLFAVWCARQVEHLMADERSISALVVAENFAHEEATRAELGAAWAAACAAAWAAAWDAGDAAWAAASAAACAAAGDAARDAARDAASAAACAAACDAGDAAWDAGDAARAAAGAAQVEQLLKMVCENEDT